MTGLPGADTVVGMSYTAKIQSHSVVPRILGNGDCTTAKGIINSKLHIPIHIHQSLGDVI